MKKSMLIALMGIFTYMSASAENEEINNTMAEPEAAAQEMVMNTTEAEQTAEAKSVENGLMMQYPTLQSATQTDVTPSRYNEGFKQTAKWKKARTLRNVGMITTLASFVAMPIAASIVKKDFHEGESETTKAITSIFDFQIAAKGVGYCLPTLTAGIIMWAVGGSKMKSARLSYTGSGVAYNF